MSVISALRNLLLLLEISPPRCRRRKREIRHRDEQTSHYFSSSLSESRVLRDRSRVSSSRRLDITRVVSYESYLPSDKEICNFPIITNATPVVGVK